MRILIISDSHGNTDNIEFIRKEVGKIDRILHCGDGASESEYISRIFGCPVTVVSGNCDMFSFDPEKTNLNIEGKCIHMEHGHRLPIFDDTAMLDYAAANGFDVLLFGHTHIQKILSRDGRYVVNPGSISRPRDGFPSYCILETDGKGGFTFVGHRI